MRTPKVSKHLNEEVLLAYLDGELSSSRIRRVRNHLTSCWKCRSVLADLETQAEAVSRLLSVQLDSEIDRSIRGKERFLRWRELFEKRRDFLSRQRQSVLYTDMVKALLA